MAARSLAAFRVRYQSASNGPTRTARKAVRANAARRAQQQAGGPLAVQQLRRAVYIHIIDSCSRKLVGVAGEQACPNTTSADSLAAALNARDGGRTD